MKIFGFTVDRGILDEACVFDALAESYYYFEPAVATAAGSERTGALVLHGIGGTPANVRVVADELAARGYTVYAPLLPGHGKTVRALCDSTGEQWLRCAMDGYDRLRAAGCTRIVPVGLSLGGVLAGLLAAERECAALVLISTPVRLRAYLHAARIISPLVPAIRYSDYDKGKLEKKQPYGQMYAGFSASKIVDLYALIRRLRRSLPRIACPTLALWAKYDDKVAPSAEQALVRGLTGARLTSRTMENSPHGSTYDPRERDLVARLVADFIDGTRAQNAASASDRTDASPQ